MKVSLVRVGNSHGVRIPKAIIEQCGFGDEIDMAVKGGTVVLAPARRHRAGWDAAFEAMAAAGDDAPLLPDDATSAFDTSEWTW